MDLPFSVGRQLPGRMVLQKRSIAEAAFQMVIDDAAGLQMGINCDASQVFEATALQFFGNAVRQAIGGRDISQGMTGIQKGAVA